MWCDQEGAPLGKGEGELQQQSSAPKGVGHARSQPALSDRKDSRSLACSERFVEMEHSTVGAVVLGTMDRKRSAKPPTVGLVCRGQDDVFAHGYGDIRNLKSFRIAGLKEPA